jgi:1-acyl-sn-glycerol-3-phosphate acyltransferase
MRRPPVLWKLAQGLCRILTSVVFDLKVYGVRNVPSKGGVLIVTNHESHLDPVLIGVQLPRPISYLAKSELFVNPFFGWLIRNLYAFPVRQGAGDVGAMKETINRLKEGHLLNIFPEGSRSMDGELLPVQAGVALVVRRAGVPVVPCVIDGSYEAMPRGSKLPHRRPIRVMYGRPIDMSGWKTEQVVSTIETRWREMMAALRQPKATGDHLPPGT